MAEARVVSSPPGCLALTMRISTINITPELTSLGPLTLAVDSHNILIRSCLIHVHNNIIL